MIIFKFNNNRKHFVDLPTKRDCSIYKTRKCEMEGFPASDEAFKIVSRNIRRVYMSSIS